MSKRGSADRMMAIAHTSPIAIDADVMVLLFNDNGYRIDVYLRCNRNSYFIIQKYIPYISRINRSPTSKAKTGEYQYFLMDFFVLFNQRINCRFRRLYEAKKVLLNSVIQAVYSSQI